MKKDKNIVMGLTYIRQIKGISMIELATIIKVTKATVSKWERLKMPLTKNRLKQLSSIFKIEEKYFQKVLTKNDKLYILQTEMNFIKQEV